MNQDTSAPELELKKRNLSTLSLALFCLFPRSLRHFLEKNEPAKLGQAYKGLE